MSDDVPTPSPQESHPPELPAGPRRDGLTEAEQREYDQLDRISDRTAEQNERWLWLLSKAKTLFG